MDKRKYRNSICRGNWLHKFKIVNQLNAGLLERCERCGKTMFFSINAPNLYYMSYHIREILRANDPLFRREYPNAL